MKEARDRVDTAMGAVDEANDRLDATKGATRDRELLLHRSIEQIKDVSGDIGSLQKRHKKFQDVLQVDLQKEKVNAEKYCTAAKKSASLMRRQIRAW